MEMLFVMVGRDPVARGTPKNRRYCDGVLTPEQIYMVEPHLTFLSSQHQHNYVISLYTAEYIFKASDVSRSIITHE